MTTNVQFEEENFTPVRPYQEATGIIGFLIAKGVVKSVQQAKNILIIITILSFLTSVFILVKVFIPSIFRANVVNPKIYLEDIPPEAQKQLPADFLKTLPSRSGSNTQK